MTKLELDISNLPPKQGSWLRCFRLALTIDKRTSCRTSIVIQTTNPKKYLFPLSQSLYWRPSADQKARGLWVRDCKHLVIGGTSFLARSHVTIVRHAGEKRDKEARNSREKDKKSKQIWRRAAFFVLGYFSLKRNSVYPRLYLLARPQ